MSSFNEFKQTLVVDVKNNEVLGMRGNSAQNIENDKSAIFSTSVVHDQLQELSSEMQECEKLRKKEKKARFEKNVQSEVNTVLESDAWIMTMAELDEYLYNPSSRFSLQAGEGSFGVNEICKYMNNASGFKKQSYWDRFVRSAQLFNETDRTVQQITVFAETVMCLLEDISVTPADGPKRNLHIKYCFVRFFRMQGYSYSDFYVKVISYFIHELGALVTGVDTLQSGAPDYLQWLRAFIEGKEMVENSLFIKKTQSLFARMVAYGFLPKLKIDIAQYFPEVNTMVKELETRPFKGGVDFFFSVCDYILFVGTKGYEACVSGTWEAFFGEKTNVSEWIKAVEDLKLKANFFNDPQVLVLAGFVTDTIDITIINNDCNSLIEKGDIFLKNKRNLHKRELDLITRAYSELMNIRVELTSTKYTMRSRPMPFGIVLHGRSGVLKTYLTRLFYQVFASAANSIDWDNKPKLNLTADDEHYYSRNPNDEYWSKFGSTMWCINFDDVGGTKASVAQGVPTDITAFLRVQNNTPYITEQADLKDKGRIPLQNLLTIGSTNVCHLDVPLYMNDTYANLRRFHMFVDVIPKSEYADATGQTIDTDKIPISDGVLNLWTFVIKKAVPDYRNALSQHVVSGPKFETVATFTEIDDMIAFYCKAVIQHLKKQERAMSQSDKLTTLDLCTTCFRPTCVCKLEDDEIIEDPIKSATIKTIAVCPICFKTNCDGHLQSDEAKDECLKSIWWKMFYFTLDIYYIMFKYSLSWAPKWVSGFNFERLFTNTIIFTMKTRMRYSKWRGMSWFERNWKSSLAILVSIMGGITLYRSFGKRKDRHTYTEQGSTGSRPQPEGEIDTKENPWKKEEINLSSMDLTPQISSWTSSKLDLFTANIQNNVLYAKFFTKSGEFLRGRILGVAGQVYVTNHHYFMLNDITAIMPMRSIETDGIISSRMERIDQIQLFTMPEYDLCFMLLPNQPPVKNIRNYFLDACLQHFYTGVCLVRQDDRTIETRVITSGKLHKGVKIEDPKAGANNIKLDLYLSKSVERFCAGECGSPLILDIANSGYAVGGIHMLSKYSVDSVEVGAAPILRKWVDAALAHFGPQIEPSEVIFNSDSAPVRSLGPLHPKSPLHWIREGDCEIYGSIGDRNINASKVVDTLICADVVQLTSGTSLPIHVKCGKPVMGRDWRPKRIALLDCVNTNTNMSYHILKRCADAYWNDIVNELPHAEWGLIQEYDLFTAINGAAGVKYVDKMNRKTSAGFPWCAPKERFLEFLPEVEGLQHPVQVNEEILKRLDILDERLRSGKRAMPIFNAQLKDEPVSLAKTISGKTRVFSSAPMDFTILVRKYLLSCVRVMQRNIFVFEAAPGVNALSPEWKGLYEHITKYSTSRIIAGDYGSFDKTMPPAVISLAFDILYKMCEKAGYTQEALLAVKAIGQDVAFPITNYFGDVVQFHGSNPSGHPLTVIINSIANSIYMRYAYYILNPAAESGSFRTYVSLLTYGDDNICGVSPKCDFFNHTGIQEALKQCGIRYTMADKEAKSVPFINITEASFLKRGFVYIDTIGTIVAQLDHSSIEKMLTKCVRSKGLTMKQHSMEVMRVALSEYFFYGPEVFFERYYLFRELYETHQMSELAPYESYMPTWDELHNRYWNNSCAAEADDESALEQS